MHPAAYVDVDEVPFLERPGIEGLPLVHGREDRQTPGSLGEREEPAFLCVHAPDMLHPRKNARHPTPSGLWVDMTSQQVAHVLLWEFLECAKGHLLWFGAVVQLPP